MKKVLLLASVVFALVACESKTETSSADTLKADTAVVVPADTTTAAPADTTTAKDSSVTK